MKILQIAIVFLPLFGELQSMQCKEHRSGLGQHFLYSRSPVSYPYMVCEKTISEKGNPLKIPDANFMPRYIFFRNSKIRDVPAKVFTSFNTTARIYLNRSEVENIDPEAFAGLAQLQELYLQNNRIDKLANGTFKSLTTLKSLDLSSNKLRKLDDGVLYGLKDLEILNLSHNELTSISSALFASPLVLRNIDLSDNSLYEVVPNTFDSTPRLHALLLNNNFFVHLPEHLFEKTTSLRVLDISNNKLQGFNFNGLPGSLEHFNMSNNDFSYIKDWSWLKNIATVDLRSINITEISDVGKGIVSLYLCQNKLENISRSVFAQAGDLVNLDLRGNLIRDIAEDVFQDLAKLQKLNLAHNRIEQLPAGCFKNLTSLRELKLSYNSLSNIVFGTFAGLDNLTLLYLDNNNLTAIHETSFYVLSKLRGLYLTNNEINSLNVEELLSQLSNSLKMIGFNGNKWTCSSLVHIIKILKRKRVRFSNGSDDNTENVNGIACTSDQHSFNKTSDKEQIGFLRKQSTDEASKNTNFNKYLDEGFKNSTFYRFFEGNSGVSNYLQKGFKKTNFFKYFNRDFYKSNFFKYFDKGFRNSDKTLNEGHTKKENWQNNNSDDDYETQYLDGETAKLFDEGNLSEKFLVFTNKITVCIIINIGLLFVLILIFLFVAFRKNRRYYA